MRLHFWASSLIPLLGLLFTLPASSQKLRPVKIRQYEAAFGLQRRDFDHLQDFHPQPHTELMYGLDQGEDKTLVANITLKEMPGLPLVLLERFEHLTARVDCRGKSGHISLTFTSGDTFEEALKAWRYVNDHVGQQFLLIANHDGCAPEDDRQPYVITQIREDPGSLTTHLKSRPVEWKNISDSLEMTVSAVKRLPSSMRQHPLSTRDLPYQKSNKRRRDVSELTNRGDPYKLNWQTEKDKKVKFIQSISNNIQAFCTNCLARGSFLFTFSISKKGPILDASNLSVSGSGIEAAITLSLLKRSQNQLENDDRFAQDIDVFGSAVPGLGIEIGSWAKMGLSWAYQVGYSGSLSGDFEMSVSVGTKNPGSSLLTLDLIRLDTKTANVDDWEFFQPKFNIAKLGGGGSFEFHGQLAGVFGFELIDTLTLEASVTVPIPMLKFELKPQKNQGGLCKAAGIDTGVVAQVKFGTQINIGGQYKFAGSDKDKPAGLDPLVDATFPIGGPVCVAYKVPIAGQEGEKLPPGNSPPGAKPKPKAAAGNKELSYNDDDDSDMTPEDFSGHLPSIKSDDNLAWSGDTLDDGSAPGSVTVAFDDPGLIAQQASVVANNAKPDAGSNTIALNPSKDSVAADDSGFAASLVSNSGTSADEPLYQAFLDDESSHDSGAEDQIASGNIAASPNNSGDEPLYKFFLENTPTAGSGVSGASQGDISLLATNNVNSDKGSSAPNLFTEGSDFKASMSDSGTNLLPEGSNSMTASNNEPNMLTDGSNLLTASNNEPNLFTDVSNLSGLTSNFAANMLTDGSEYGYSLGGPPTDSGMGIAGGSLGGSDSNLFAGSLSAGTELFARTTVRKVRRQELENPYPGPEGWTGTRLLRTRNVYE